MPYCPYWHIDNNVITIQPKLQSNNDAYKSVRILNTMIIFFKFL